MDLCRVELASETDKIRDAYRGVIVSDMTDQDLVNILFDYDNLILKNSIQKFLMNNPTHGLTIEFDQCGAPGVYRNFGPNGEMIDTEGISGHSLIENYPDRTLHRMFISRPIFSQLFENSVEMECSNGRVCRNQMDCLLITVEHELVHLIIDLFCPHLKNGHGDDFQERAGALFHQSESRHSLGTGCRYQSFR